MIMQVTWKDSTSIKFLGMLLTSCFSSALYIKEIMLDGNTSNMEILPKTADLNMHLVSTFFNMFSIYLLINNNNLRVLHWHCKSDQKPKAYLPMPAIESWHVAEALKHEVNRLSILDRLPEH